MLDSPNGRGQSLFVTATSLDKHSPETLLNQLKKSGIDDRLLYILLELFAEKATSKDPDDRLYFVALANEIQHITTAYSGMDLRIILMQRLIMYGLNSPQIVSYYYDAFIRLNDNIKPHDRRKLVARLIKKTEVIEFHQWNKKLPTLKESLQQQLFAWIRHVEKEEFGFFSARHSDLGPIHKLGVKIGVFMPIYRAMEEVGILKRLTKRDSLYNFMSQVIMSDDDEKLEPKTFKNRFVFDNLKDIQKAIDYLDEIKSVLTDALETELTK